LYTQREVYGPGVDSSSNRNEYQVYFVRGKGGRCVKLTTLPTSCAVVMKSGNLTSWNPLGQSWPVTGLLYLYLLHRGKAEIEPQPIRNLGSRRDGWSAPHPGHFTLRKDMEPILEECGWHAGRSGRTPKILPPPAFDSHTVQP